MSVKATSLRYGIILKDYPEALRVRISQKFTVEFEKGILTVIALYHPIASSSCADAFKPVTHCPVQLIVNGCVERQQACEIYSEVTEVRVIVTVQIDEPDIEIAGAGVTVKEEAEAVVFVHESVVVRFHSVCLSYCEGEAVAQATACTCDLPKNRALYTAPSPFAP